MTAATAAPMATAGLAIFVKTPGHSPLKTRLAAGIGREAAEAFHRLAVAAVAEVARAAQAQRPGLCVYWAVAEASALDDALWRDFPVLAQGEGDLGARMRTVCDQLRAMHGRALLIGADAPQLTAGDLCDACDALDAQPCVLGPSEDGGFWLLGTCAALPEAVWRHTPWSQPDTAARFLAHAGMPAVARLRSLRDVDTADDLSALATALDALPDPLPAQRRLRASLADAAPDGTGRHPAHAALD